MQFQKANGSALNVQKSQVDQSASTRKKLLNRQQRSAEESRKAPMRKLRMMYPPKKQEERERKCQQPLSVSAQRNKVLYIKNIDVTFFAASKRRK